MSDIRNAIRDFLSGFDDSRYPADFLSDFTILECLASHNGMETFLVQKKDADEQYIVKCFDKQIYTFDVSESKILKGINHNALPKFFAEYENEKTLCVAREYIRGLPLDKYAEQRQLDTNEVIRIGTELCDILTYLHTREQPVIHRDIKPQNVVIAEDGKVWLIDFDIARVYDADASTDTQFFGTKEYAPPEQYGFTQTDARTDIYSLGVLLRWLLTGSEKENQNIRLYQPLAKVIRKCTAFSPKERFANAAAVKRGLLAANPKTQVIRKTLIAVCSLVILSLCIFGGVKWYEYATFNPFAEGSIPAVLTNEERVADAVSYLNDKYQTNLFDDTNSYADIGFLKMVLTDVYDYDKEYVYALPTADGPPQESENNFFPWGIGDEQYVPRDIMAYMAVKIYWKEKVSDYSTLKDDNGVYPGVRVAIAFCEETGILTGIGRPEDITKGEAAIALANADRIFEATKAD